MDNKIDFVITWVDGNDPEWLEEKRQYDGTIKNSKNTDNNLNRYRDMGILKYWFRGVEKYAPWVNKIHFVVWKNIPEWLNENNPKLNIVKHDSFIPKEYLPTFNSNCIELNLHRLKDLSEKFVLFNDDMFIVNPLNEEYFFKDNLPCDYWKENAFKTENAGDNFFDHIILNNLFLINKNFDKQTVFKNNYKKIFNLKYGKRNIRYLMLKKWNYFTGFDCPHTANPYLKSSLAEIWEKESQLLDQTCSHKFRSVLDINQWLINWWQMCLGNFSVRNHNTFGQYYALSDTNTDLFNYILDSNSSIVCINDSNPNVDFEKASSKLVEIFEQKLPEKSSFEK